MRTLILTLTMIILLFAPAVMAEETPEESALRAAESFLSLINEKSIDLAYLSTDPYLQAVNPQELWVRSIGAQRTFYGERTGTSIRAVNTKETLFRHPDGSYVSIIFESTFERKSYSIERLEMVLGIDGTWRVAEYFWN